MMDEFNKYLPTIVETEDFNFTQGRMMASEIQQWMRPATRRLVHYKIEHNELLKEAITLLEPTLWKANLDDIKVKGRSRLEREGVRLTI